MFPTETFRVQIPPPPTMELSNKKREVACFYINYFKNQDILILGKTILEVLNRKIPIVNKEKIDCFGEFKVYGFENVLRNIETVIYFKWFEYETNL